MLSFLFYQIERPIALLHRRGGPGGGKGSSISFALQAIASLTLSSLHSDTHTVHRCYRASEVLCITQLISGFFLPTLSGGSSAFEGGYVRPYGYKCLDSAVPTIKCALVQSHALCQAGEVQPACKKIIIPEGWTRHWSGLRCGPHTVSRSSLRPPSSPFTCSTCAMS